MKESIALHIKHWFKVTVILWISFMVFEVIRASVTGVPSSPMALQIAGFGGTMIHVFLFWMLIPYLVLKSFKKIFGRKQEVAIEIIHSAKPFNLSSNGAIYENQQNQIKSA